MRRLRGAARSIVIAVMLAVPGSAWGGSRGDTDDIAGSVDLASASVTVSLGGRYGVPHPFRFCATTYGLATVALDQDDSIIRFQIDDRFDRRFDHVIVVRAGASGGRAHARLIRIEDGTRRGVGLYVAPHSACVEVKRSLLGARHDLRVVARGVDGVTHEIDRAPDTGRVRLDLA
jgi:hypothetical protein